MLARTCSILAFALLSLALPAAAHDEVVIQRDVAGYYLHAQAHSDPEGVYGPGCPTMCPMPETQTLVYVAAWQETNGCPDLQRTVTTCSGAETRPDTLIAERQASAP